MPVTATPAPHRPVLTQVTRFPSVAPGRIVARGARRGALIWAAVFGLVTWAEASQFAKEYPPPPTEPAS